MGEKDSNEKQNIKSQRVRTYFVQAAKELILQEGVEGITVRKVAEKAGYTFATIYNYFTDLNELLGDVKTAMILDLLQYMHERLPSRVTTLDDIVKTHRVYIDYYMEHPQVFRFFYSYRLNEIKTKPAALPDFEKSWGDTYRCVVESGLIRESEVPVVAKTIIYAMHGALVLYFSGNGMTPEQIYAEVEESIRFLLKGRE